MALVLADRVRDTTTTTGTGTVTLSGTAPTGYQNFSVIGNANTTYYTINAGSQWEVGIGTYSSTGPTLARTTVLESSNANALVNFSAGTKDVFVTYPSDRAVTTDGTETLTNKTINGSNNTITNISLTSAVTGTLPVANGGTGVTASSGANSVVLRNVNQNFAVNNIDFGFTSIATAAGTTTLTVASTNTIFFTGSTTQTVVMPVTSTLVLGSAYFIRNNSTGDLTINSSGGNLIATIIPGLSIHIVCINTAVTTAAGWDFGFTDFADRTGTGNVVLSASPTLTGTANVTNLTASATLSTSGVLSTSSFASVSLIATGTIIIGATNATNSITLGQSTASQTTSIQGGATTSGNTKTINIGTAGLSGSTTNITIGSAVSGATSTTTLNGTVSIASVIAAPLGSAAAPSYTFTGDTNTGMWSPGADTIAFSEGGVEAMRITDAGNVGIGTSAPDRKLDVQGSGSITVRSRSTDTTGVTVGILAAEHASGSSLQVRAGVGFTNLISTGAADPLILSTNSAERMRITSAGNVGIGTTTPLARLFAETPTSVGAALAYAANSNGAYPTGVFGGSFGYNFSAGGAEVDFWNGWTGATGTQGGFAFRRQTGASSQNLLMTIRGDGNVGIGTSSPLYQATVLGLGQDTAALTDAGNKGGSLYLQATGVTSGSGGAVLFGTTFGNQTPFAAIKGLVSDGSANTVGELAFSTRNAIADTALTERLRINSSGNVGIGTSNPGYRLDIASGDTSAGLGYAMRLRSNATATAATLQFTNSAVSTQNGLIACTDTGGMTMQSDGASSVLAFRTNGNERMRIDSTGNVGIGTSSPGSFRLNVQGNAYATTTAIGTDENLLYQAAANTLGFRVGTSTNQSYFNIKGVSGTPLLDGSGGVLALGTAGTERARINSSGELLVGTTTGGRTVCINAADNWMRFQNPSRSWLIGPSIGSNFNIFDETAGYTAFSIDTSANINARNSMFLGSGQNLDNKIEIGAGRTGNNYAYIDLIGDTTYTDYGLRLIRGNGGANTTSQLVHRGTGDIYITTQDAAPMYFQTNSTTRMYIEAGGTVQMSGSLLVGRSSASTDVNTANDTGSFSVRGSSTTIASMSFHRTGAFAINMGLGTDNVFRIGGWSASSNAFQMDSGGNLTMLGNVTAYSDARIKKDVETIDSALDLVSKMRGVRYTRIDNDKRGVGVIAQEMLEVCPEVVQQGVGDDDTLSVAYGNLVGVLIEAVKELTARVAELEGK